MKEIAIIGRCSGLAVHLTEILRDHIRKIEVHLAWDYTPDNLEMIRGQFNPTIDPIKERKVKSFRPMNKTKKVFKQSMNRGK